MRKYLLLIFLFYTQLLSSEIIIKDNHSSYKDFEVQFHQETIKKLGIEEIQEINEFQKTSNSIALGERDGTIWYHFSIKNITNETQKRVFFITESSLFDFDLYVIENKKIIATQSIRPDRSIGSYPELEISLDSQKKLDIYFRVNLQYHHTYKVEINTSKDLAAYKVLKTSLLYFYFGAVSSLLLYNLFIYLTTRDNNYLLYSGFVFFYLIAQVQLNTSLNTIFSSLETAFLLSTAHIFWLGFHTLFSLKLLSVQEYYPRWGKTLLYTGYFLLANGIFGLFHLELAVDMMMPFMLLLPFVFLFLALNLYLKKNEIALFYIIAQTLFLISSFILGILVSGALEHNNFTRYIHLVGSFSEIILFSFALAYKTRLVMQENEKQKELVDEYSKLTYIGETITSIHHQWKSPVNNIYNYITHIETAKEFKDKNIDTIIETNLEKIKQNTQYLRDTASEFLKINNLQSSSKENIYLNEELDSVMKIMEPEFRKNKIKIIGNYDQDIFLNTHKNQLRNLFMILVENAIKTFRNRSVKNPEFSFRISSDEKSVICIIEDNAGGISEKPIDKIFERYYSASDSSGIGLYLAKYVLMENLRGDISVVNTSDGAKFTIVIPIN